MLPQLPSSWRPLLAEEIDKPYFRKLEQFLEKERRSFPVFPPEEDTFPP